MNDQDREQYKAELNDRADQILDSVQEALRRSGRKPGSVRLMGVSKTRSVDEILTAREAGITLLGENRVQEALSKEAAFGDRSELHLIGPLQSNKVSAAVGFFPWIDAVDRLKIVRCLDNETAKQEKTLRVMVEINSSGEASKHGFSDWDDLAPALELISRSPGLILSGMMTLGPLGGDEMENRKAFEKTRLLYEKGAEQFGYPEESYLSMGMSGDYETAVEEGSTLIRVGTFLFGPRRLL